MEELHIPGFTLTPSTNRRLKLKALKPTLPYLSVHLWYKWLHEQLTDHRFLSLQTTCLVYATTNLLTSQKHSQFMGTVLKDQGN